MKKLIVLLSLITCHLSLYAAGATDAADITGVELSAPSKPPRSLKKTYMGIDWYFMSPYLKKSRIPFSGASKFAISGGFKLRYGRLGLEMSGLPAWWWGGRMTSEFHDSRFGTLEWTKYEINDLTTLMPQAYFDLNVLDFARPYVGVAAGLGFFRAKYAHGQRAPVWSPAETYSESYDKTVANLTYAIMTGVNFHIAKGIRLNVGYRYHDFGRVGTSDNDRVVGRTYTFGLTLGF
jgi:opacity protein-like surface antigen